MSKAGLSRFAQEFVPAGEAPAAAPQKSQPVARSAPAKSWSKVASGAGAAPAGAASAASVSAAAAPAASPKSETKAKAEVKVESKTDSASSKSVLFPSAALSAGLPKTVYPAAKLGQPSSKQIAAQFPPPPVRKSADEPAYFSLDVECVATGPKHDERAVAQVALVDEFERVVLNFYVKPEKKPFSYLPALTGLTAELVEGGVSLAEATKALQAALPSNAVLVGQGIVKDTQWMNITEGKDFGGVVDLGGLWRVRNPKFNNFSYFSLQHKASTLMGLEQPEPHNAASDAIMSMRVFLLWKYLEGRPQDLQKACDALLASKPGESFAMKNATYDGVCMGNRKTCTCGAPFIFS